MSNNTSTHEISGHAHTRRRLLALGLTMFVGVGCKEMRQNMEASERLRKRLQSDLGVDSVVNVTTINSATTVTVQLGALPSGDPKRVKARVEALAKSEFPTLSNIVILARL